LKDNETIKRLIKISEGWYAIAEKDGKLYFNDLRFGVYDLSAEDLNFAFSYQLITTADGLTIKEAERDKDAMKSVLGNLWARIWGN